MPAASDPHQEMLRALGLIDAGAESSLVNAECVRVARTLREAGCRVIGLVPATRDDAVPPVAIRLGIALVQLSGATVAYIDANVHWPALSAIAERPSASPGEGDGTGAGEVYATRWLSGTLALLTPPRVETAGEVVPQLRRVLDNGAELFQFVLVDLTGFDVIGEHAAAAALMDGVIIVGRAGKTKETVLLAHRDELRTARLLGVLLVG